MANQNYKYHNPNGVVDNDVAIKDSTKYCCSIKCLKFPLQLFNILCFLMGSALVAVGVRFLTDKHPSLMLLSSGLYDLAAYIAIVAGCIILLTAIFGCIGICRSSHTQVLIYAIMLGVIFVLEIGAGILCYAYRGSLSNELSENLTEKFLTEYGLANQTTMAVDHLQVSLKCCGVESFEDWKRSSWWQSEERRNNLVPDSCCITPSRSCGIRDHPSNIRYTGCIDRIAKIAGDNLIILGALAVGTSLLQMVAITIACVLRCKIRELTHYG